uniref:Decapping nuclease n=1 Tax=Strongyloides venezuelensis TaxID=75913 RepID=A0A0K0F687_STRVS
MQPVKLFAFFCKKDKSGDNFYLFGDKFFPRFDNRSEIINPPLNIKTRFEKYLKKPHLSVNTCQWDVMVCMKQKIGTSLEQLTDYSDIVCYRGFLKELALIPLGENSKNTYVAFMLNGIIFIERINNSTCPMSKKDIEKEYMKKKLSKICTIPHDKKYPDVNSSIIFEEGYYVAKTRIFKTTNSTIKVMFTGDVDAIDPNSTSRGNNFMKIKVCPGHIMHLFKDIALHKTWAQSFIAGNEVIGAGIRRKSLVREVKYFNISELESKLPVTPSNIMEFLGKCLENIICACKKYPNKYIIIPEDKVSLRVEEEETVRNINFSRPTQAFLKIFSVKRCNK